MTRSLRHEERCWRQIRWQSSRARDAVRRPQVSTSPPKAILAASDVDTPRVGSAATAFRGSVAHSRVRVGTAALKGLSQARGRKFRSCPLPEVDTKPFRDERDPSGLYSRKDWPQELPVKSSARRRSDGLIVEAKLRLREPSRRLDVHSARHRLKTGRIGDRRAWLASGQRAA